MHMPAIVVAFVLLAQVYGLVFCLVWRFKFWHHSRKGFVLITLVAFALTSKSLRSCFRRSDDPFVFRPKELVLLFVQLTAFFAQKGGVKTTLHWAACSLLNCVFHGEQRLHSEYSFLGVVLRQNCISKICIDFLLLILMLS